MILNKGPPSEFETSNKISNSGGTDMYIEHPYFYEGKYYANIDGEMIEVIIGWIILPSIRIYKNLQELLLLN